MKKTPPIDSVLELARFWDAHDLTEFDSDIEEETDPVFVRENQTVVRIRLQSDQAAALHRMAGAKGVDDAELVRNGLKRNSEFRESATARSIPSKARP